MGSDGGGKIENSIIGLIRFADRLRKQAPSLLSEIRTYARYPRTLSALIESRSPWLNRRFMSAASNIAEPFTIGMGLKVSRFTGDAIEVSLPAGWRNRGEGGRIHSGAIAALGESTVRMYWDFHLDLKISDVEARRVSMQVLTSPESDLKAVFRLPEVDREAILHRLRVDRSLSLETRTLIYDSVDRLVAEVDIDWHLSRRLTLSGATGHRE